MGRISAFLALSILLARAPRVFAQTAGEAESVRGNPAEGEPSAELDDFEEFGDQKDEIPAKRVFDPLSGYNRVVFKFNDNF